MNATIDDLMQQTQANRQADADSARADKLEALEDKRKEMRTGILGGAFKYSAQLAQAPVALLPQDQQKALQPVVAVTQLSAGLVSLFSSALSLRKLSQKLESTGAGVDPTDKAPSTSQNPAMLVADQGSGPTGGTTP